VRLIDPPNAAIIEERHFRRQCEKMFRAGHPFYVYDFNRQRFNRRDRERSRDDLKRVDYRAAVMNAHAMLPLSSNQLMVLHEQPEAIPA
jgi:hypothetical protein